MKPCIRCGAEVASYSRASRKRHSNAKYCGTACKDATNNAKRALRNQAKAMPRAKPPKRGYFPRWPTPMLLEDDAVS